jgi:tetratricopeptide (TPR) repeat protein
MPATLKGRVANSNALIGKPFKIIRLPLRLKNFRVMMRRFFGFLFVLSFLLTSCSTTGSVSKTKTSADQLYKQGEYQQAMTIWEADIRSSESKGRENVCESYTPAAYAAIKLHQYDKAILWLKKATYSEKATDSTYVAMAEVYRVQDNLSLEMLALQDYMAKYPQGKYSEKVGMRLFEIYTESGNWELAEKQYGLLPEDKKRDESYLMNYLTINQALDYKEICDSIVGVLLEVNPKQIVALNWMGKKYYHLAEEAYQNEMTAYEQNKTRKQYNQLLKALDAITTDFKKAMDYFAKSYELNPDPQVANYLSYIYNRLDDKKKSEYYRRLSER